MYLRADNEYDLALVRGTTFECVISVADADGEAYTLAAGEKLLFGVKRTPTDVNLELVKTLTASDALPTGGYKLSLTPDDTEGLPSGMHCYDVGLVSGSEYYNVIPISRFCLVENVTSKSKAVT